MRSNNISRKCGLRVGIECGLRVDIESYVIKNKESLLIAGCVTTKHRKIK